MLNDYHPVLMSDRSHAMLRQMLLCGVLGTLVTIGGCQSDGGCCELPSGAKINNVADHAEGTGSLRFDFESLSLAAYLDLYIDDNYVGAYRYQDQSRMTLPAGWHTIRLVSTKKDPKQREYIKTILILGNDSKQTIAIP